MSDDKKTLEEDTVIDIESILLDNRNLFLDGEISYELSADVCKSIIALSQLNTDPIKLWINCSGGSIGAGLALIDIIQLVKAPIYTIIKGNAGSMGALVSVAAHRRYMTENSFWMFHDLMAFVSGDGEYGDKLITRCSDYYVKLQEFAEFHLKKHTSLTVKDLHKARTKELWFFAKECKTKGIVDSVFKTAPKRKQCKGELYEDIF